MDAIETEQEFRESKCEQCRNTFSARVFRLFEREICLAKLCAECATVLPPKKRTRKYG